MKVTKVGYSRKFNLGGYETQDVWMEAEIVDGDDATEAVRQLKAEIETCFSNAKKQADNCFNKGKEPEKQVELVDI